MGIGKLQKGSSFRFVILSDRSTSLGRKRERERERKKERKKERKHEKSLKIGDTKLFRSHILASSVTRFGEISPLWQSYDNLLANFGMVFV